MQPYTFGAILNRDDCFNQLVAHGSKLNLPWAVVHRGKDHLKNEPHSTAQDQPDQNDQTSTKADKTFRLSDLKQTDDYDDLTTFAS